DPLPVGAHLSEAMAARLAPLSPEARRALVISAAGAGDPGLVAEGLRAAGVEAAIHEAEEADLVSLGVEGVAFRHPLMRSSGYLAARPADRRDAHGLLAEAARRRGEAGVEALAHHLAAAAQGPDDDAAAALEAAGRRATTRTGYAEAAETMRRAAGLSDRRA